MPPCADVVVIPGGAEHEGWFREDAEVFFAPPREDFLLIWDYLPWGPWKSEAEYTNVLRQQSARHDQIYYAVRPSSGGKACGQTSFLDIQPEQGVIEIGSIWFGMTLRRTRSATESMYLMLCHAMDDLGYRRMQWRCNALNALLQCRDASRHASKRSVN